MRLSHDWWRVTPIAFIWCEQWKIHSFLCVHNVHTGRWHLSSIFIITRRSFIHQKETERGNNKLIKKWIEKKKKKNEKKTHLIIDRKLWFVASFVFSSSSVLADCYTWIDISNRKRHKNSLNGKTMNLSRLKLLIGIGNQRSFSMDNHKTAKVNIITIFLQS